MGAAFKLTDAIDESIVKKLRLIKDESDSTAESYAKLVDQMSQIQRFNPKGLDELREKAAKYNETAKQLRETQTKLNELQKQQAEIYKKVAKDIEEQVRTQTQKAKLEGQLLANEQKRLRNQQLVEKQNRRVAVSEEDISRALNEQAKSMAQATEQNRILRQAMRETDLTAADSAEKMERYNQKIMENEELLEKNSDAMIQRKRNIGNYASAWNGLGVSVQQLARELPSLSMGFNTFFLAISNNLPMLADEIKRARMEFQASKAAGEQATPVWKQLTGAIFNWQTALVVGITIFSMYGKDIIEWVGNLFKGKDAVDAMAESEKNLQEARVKGLKETSKERAELNALYKASQDSNRSLEDRKAAVDELQKRYPDYLGNISDEDFLSGKAKTAVDNLTASLIAQAQARAVLDKITEISNKRLEYELENQEKQKKNEETIQNLKEKTKEGTLTQDITPVQMMGTASAAAISGAGKVISKSLTKESIAYNQAVSSLENYNAELAKFDEQITLMIDKLNVKDLGTDAGGAGSGIGGTVKSQFDIEKELIESRIALIEDERERELAELNQNFSEKMEQIKGNSDKEIELRSNLEAIKSQKIEEIELKYRTKRDKVLKEQEEKARQDRIDELNQQSEIEATNLVTSQIEENLALEEKYKEGLINREEYEREKFELQKKYNAMALRNTIDTAQAIIDLMPDGADKDAAIAKLRQQQAKLKEVMSSEFKNDKGGDDKDWGAKTWQEQWSEAIDYVSQGFNEVVNLMGGITDRQIQEIEEEMEANEEAGEKELERIQRLADSGVITTEEAEARKRAAEEKTAKKNEELEKKKAALQTKQAKLEKAANIASVIMNTASAIMKAWGQTGIFGAPMAALIGAMGAIQLATVIATPIPKYAKGTSGHKGGLAWVGDGGVSETVITDRGMYLTPDTPTLVDLPRGAKVIPYAIDMERMKARANDLEGLMAYRQENNLPPIMIENDYSGLQRDIKRLEESQRKGFKELSRAIKNNDYRQFASRI